MGDSPYGSQRSAWWIGFSEDDINAPEAHYYQYLRDSAFPYLCGEIASHAHPARKQRPPTGVIAPNQRTPVYPIIYKLPLKIIMPAKSSHHAPRFAAPESASTNNAIA